MSSARADADPKTGLLELPIDRIRPNEGNPRLVFPQDELDRLAESIDKEGILVPIVVYPKDDHFVLVDGERRFKVAQILGLDQVPAVITVERSEEETLVQMFNIHLIREPWRDMPTAKALERLIASLEESGQDVSDKVLRDKTGLSIERVRQLRYVLELPKDWQGYISDGTIPLNWFWELKRNVIDFMAKQRPSLLAELGPDEVASAFVEKRLDGVITDTVGLRKVRPIIAFAAADAESSASGTSFLDQTIRDLVRNPELSIDEAYEDTVQIMVEADKLERRTRAMLASFERLLQRARSPEEKNHVRSIGEAFVKSLRSILKS